MIYNAGKKEIILSNKIVNELDRFVIDFLDILDSHSNCVIVSGYVSIVLGRTRASEDIDLLVPKMGFDEFFLLFKELDKKGFECLNSSDAMEAFEIWHQHAIRFSRKGQPIPNMEFKMITNQIQEDAFENRIKLALNDRVLYISPLELQIAYKLSIVGKGDFEEISSDKDFEDAKHIYEYFKDKLNKEKLSYYIGLFKAEEMWKWLQK